MTFLSEMAVSDIHYYTYNVWKKVSKTVGVFLIEEQEIKPVKYLDLSPIVESIHIPHKAKEIVRTLILHQAGNTCSFLYT
jgi:hypothetical protein